MSPACGRCRKGGNEDDCEYIIEHGGLTRSQVLEASIDRLKARIRELEHPNVNTAAVQSHEPHIGGNFPTVSLRPSAIVSSSFRTPVGPNSSVIPANISLPYGWWEPPAPPREVAAIL